MAKRSSAKQSYAVSRTKSNIKTKIAQMKAKNQKPVKKTTFGALKKPVSMPQTVPAPAATPAAATPVASTTTEKLHPGFKAKASYQNGNVNISTDIRFITEKTSHLIDTVEVDSNMQEVEKHFEAPAGMTPTPRVEVYRNKLTGAVVPKAEVKDAQRMPDGSLKIVDLKNSKNIKIEPVDSKIPNEFLPKSFMEVWGEDEDADDGLRKICADLVKNGQVGAIKEFCYFGTMYYGFLKPVMSKDGKQFGVEVMMCENLRQKKRWMLAEPGTKAAKAGSASKPVVPQLF